MLLVNEVTFGQKLLKPFIHQKLLSRAHSPPPCSFTEPKKPISSRVKQATLEVDLQNRLFLSSTVTDIKWFSILHKKLIITLTII